MQKPIDELIQKLLKQKKKILPLDDLKNLINISFWENTPLSKIYKITFQLKNRWYLISLRKELFYITNPEKPITTEEIEEQRYRKLLKDHCSQICKKRYIWWLTALEIHLHWTWITLPETITVINEKKQTTETLIFDKQISFKKFETKWKNMISSLMKLTNEVDMINSKNIPISKYNLYWNYCRYLSRNYYSTYYIERYQRYTNRYS